MMSALLLIVIVGIRNLKRYYQSRILPQT